MPIPAKPLVLIVDDDSAVRCLMDAVLVAEGFNVAAAANGRDGFEQAVALQPHVIISDRNMPVMDGLAMLQALRACETTRQTPFIFVTGSQVPDVRALCETYSVAAFIQKPFDLGDFLNRVRAIVAQA